MKRAGPGWLLLSLAGLAALLGSFLPFYTFAGGGDATVWSRGLFPTATLIPLLGFAIGLEALFVLLRGREPRSPFLNFTWEQVRLAVGAVMILLALSYLVQDRAGGTLGVGYLVLSLSALATFGGGVMTRRVQLARAPGEEAPVREPRPRLKPAVATANRMGSELAKSVAGVRDNVKTRLASRKEARADAKAAAAAAAAVAAAAKAEADAKAEVAAKAEAATKATAKAEAAAKAEADAKAEAVAKAEAPTAEEPAAEAPAMQPPPPTKTFDVPPSQLPAAAENVEVAATDPPPPGETFDLPPAESPPAPEKLAEEPAAADDAPEKLAEGPATEPIPVVEEPDKTAEAPTPEPTAAVEEPEQSVEEPPAKEAKKPARVAPLSAVPPKPDPDATAPLETGTPPSDNDTENTYAAGDDPVARKPKGARKSTARKAQPEEQEEGEQETERAETGTES
jgi:hypothetical protein